VPRGSAPHHHEAGRRNSATLTRATWADTQLVAHDDASAVAPHSHRRPIRLFARVIYLPIHCLPLQYPITSV
jgi:hypothetical protein